MSSLELSVKDLKRFKALSRQQNYQQIASLVAQNFSRTNDARRGLTPNYDRLDDNLAKSIILHDEVVAFYRDNQSLSQQELAERFSDIKSVFEAHDLDNPDSVYGRKVDEMAVSISEYLSGNFEEASTVETEVEMENRGLFGRADIIRELEDGSKEMRDIKMGYSGKNPLEEYGMACYALISRSDYEIEKFILEYPLQEMEVEVQPEDWFSVLISDIREFEELEELYSQNNMIRSGQVEDLKT